MNTLEQICEKKREHIKIKKSISSLDDLKNTIAEIPTPRGFLNSLKLAKGPALIAEVKKASPSKGIIRADFNPVDIACIYEKSGASCISVLTDEPYFQGHDDYLMAIKKSVKLPLLRKDFMIDPYQIYESRALGADCILLIMAALEDREAKELYDLSVELGMDVLVEVHDLGELSRALKLDPMMIGVNNRNLKTLKVDLQTSFDLTKSIPSTSYKIAESGITNNQTVMDLMGVGYRAFLVGESLMREDDIAAATCALLNGN